MSQIPPTIGDFSVPNKLRYVPKAIGISGKRYHQRIEPDGANKRVHQTSSSRQRRTLHIPYMEGAFMDPEQLRLVWDSVCCYDGTATNTTTTTDGQSVILPDGQYGFINSLRVKSGTALLAEKLDYNRLHTFLKKCNMNKEYYDTVGATEGYWGSFLNEGFRYANQILNIQEGDTGAVAEQAAIADTTLAGAVAAQTAYTAIEATSVVDAINDELITRGGAMTRYSIHPHIILFDLPKAIHLGDFPNGISLEIEFEFPNIATSSQSYASYMTGVISDGNRLNTGSDLDSRSYVIDNLGLEMEYVVMDDTFVALWNQIKSTTGHNIHFSDWEVRNKNYTAGLDTIADSISNVKSVYAFYQGINQVNGDRGYALDKYVDMNMKSYYFGYGSLICPEKDGIVYDSTLSVNYNFVAENLKANGKYSDIDGGCIINYKDPATIYSGSTSTDSDSADAYNGKDFYIGGRFIPFVNDDSYTMETGTLRVNTRQNNATTSGNFVSYYVLFRDKMITFDTQGGIGVSE